MSPFSFACVVILMSSFGYAAGSVVAEAGQQPVRCKFKTSGGTTLVCVPKPTKASNVNMYRYRVGPDNDLLYCFADGTGEVKPAEGEVPTTYKDKTVKLADAVSCS